MIKMAISYCLDPTSSCFGMYIQQDFSFFAKFRYATAV